MSRSQESFGKKEKEKKRLKKRQDKLAKKEERKASSPGGGLDSMMAYVDEFGNISDTPPDLSKKEEVDAESIELGVPTREAEEPAGDPTGRVEYFDHSKGFGFIKDEMGGDKYFVHVSACIDEVTEGDKVTFNLEKGPRGMNAVSVKKI